MRKLLKPLIVFCILFRFTAVSRKILFFIIVVAITLTLVILFSIGICRIDPGSRVGVNVFSFSFFFQLLPLLILLGVLKRLCIPSGVLVWLYLLSLGLGVFFPKIFCRLALIRSLSLGNGMSKGTILRTSLVYFSGVGSGLEVRLCLGFHGSFNYFFAGIKFSTLLI